MPIIDLRKIRTENHWTNKIKDGARNFGRKVANKTKEAVEFVRDNPETAAMLITAGGAVCGVIGKITKSAAKTANLRQERFNKERFTYDHRSNMYLKYKRPLRKEDIANIEALRKKGLTKTQALLKLDLLE